MSLAEAVTQTETKGGDAGNHAPLHAGIDAPQDQNGTRESEDIYTGKCTCKGGKDGRRGIAGDSHMHTSFSTDSETPAEEMILAAIEKGLESVCITDHMDVDFPPDEELGDHPFLFDPDEYFRKLGALRDQYRDRLEVRIGIELGLQPHLGEVYERLTRSYPFDFVIGSVHLVDGMDPYLGEVFRGKSDGEVYRRAFQQTIENIRAVGCYDSLGHLDYVVRYGMHQAKEYSYQAFSDEIDVILKHLIANGKGLEVNTAGFKYGLDFFNPHPDVLTRYLELGGEIVTIGADAHRPEHVAWEFSRCAEILKTLGFKYYAEFKNRTPILKIL